MGYLSVATANAGLPGEAGEITPEYEAALVLLVSPDEGDVRPRSFLQHVLKKARTRRRHFDVTTHEFKRGQEVMLFLPNCWDQLRARLTKRGIVGGHSARQPSHVPVGGVLRTSASSLALLQQSCWSVCSLREHPSCFSTGTATNLLTACLLWSTRMLSAAPLSCTEFSTSAPTLLPLPQLSYHRKQPRLCRSSRSRHQNLLIYLTTMASPPQPLE